jgi:DNA-binding transcriptional ArsR family regulator
MTDKKVIVAPVGVGMKSLYVALKEFPARKIHLISSAENMQLAEKTKKELEARGIDSRIWRIAGDLWEETFRVISEISNAESDVLIHVGTADRDTQCAATSAAFVNGVRAINGDDKMVGMLPVLKFNYYTYLTEKKMSILKALEEKQYKSLDELSRKLKMSLPLLSYHIHGNYKTEGLVQMKLLELGKRGTTQAVRLTSMARLLLKGYVKQEVQA